MFLSIGSRCGDGAGGRDHAACLKRSDLGTRLFDLPDRFPLEALLIHTLVLDRVARRLFLANLVRRRTTELGKLLDALHVQALQVLLDPLDGRSHVARNRETAL